MHHQEAPEKGHNFREVENECNIDLNDEKHPPLKQSVGVVSLWPTEQDVLSIEVSRERLLHNM